MPASRSRPRAVEVEAEISTRSRDVQFGLQLSVSRRDDARGRSRRHDGRPQLQADADPVTCRRLAAADRRAPGTQHGQGRSAQTSYLAAMGISHELEDLIEDGEIRECASADAAGALSFRHRHAGCGRNGMDAGSRQIDRMSARLSLAKKADGASFRTMEWRLFCENKDRARLMFVREFDTGAAGINSVAMMAGSEKPRGFRQYSGAGWSLRGMERDTWRSDAMKVDADSLSICRSAEGTSTPDGKTSQALIRHRQRLACSRPGRSSLPLAPLLHRRRPQSPSPASHIRLTCRKRGRRRSRQLDAVALKRRSANNAP